ncbi:MAG TPA: hypothetical protein VKC51_07475 [Lacunisphaera sp.]|nr:hypothetical protein [Lacunisphaera sp.]
MTRSNRSPEDWHELNPMHVVKSTAGLSKAAAYAELNAQPARFDREDAAGLEAAVDILLRASDLGRLVSATES